MPTAQVTTSLDQPQLDVLVDLGHPLLNRVFDGFVKVGGVGAIHAATQDTYKLLLQEETNKKSLENLILRFEFSEPEPVKKSWQNMINKKWNFAWRNLQASRVGKEAVQWGLVAGVYSGATYGLQEARGVHDWKNALLGGVLTGAALSLTESNPSTDRVVRGAITGGAIATASEVLRNIT